MQKGQKKEDLVKVNFDRLITAIQESPYNQTQVAAVLGYKDAWFSRRRATGSLDKNDLKKIAILLGATENEYLLEEPPESEAAQILPDSQNNAALVMLVNMANALSDIRAAVEEIREALENKPRPPIKKKSDPERMVALLEEKISRGVNGWNILKNEFVSYCVKAGINTANMDRILTSAGYTIGKSGGKVWIMDERR
ncbi:MAG: hypothetical protein IKF75_01815 [Lachnospiraceae bacterium]|nr:hypothetical protein [Lachnospiraceae bacterium]